jgi:hypothetical protein
VAQLVRQERGPVCGRNRARTAALLFAAGTLAVTAGCSSGSGDSTAKDPSPSPSVSRTPTKSADPTEVAKSAAIGVYKAYWLEMEKRYADSTGKKGDLKKYAASTALLQANADAKSAHDRKLINVGHVTVGNPTATQANMNRQVPNVVISSCLDVSQWNVINTATKKPASLPAKRLTKYVIVATVERLPEGWRVTRNEPKGQAC